jgi:hypothetical protein
MLDSNNVEELEDEEPVEEELEADEEVDEDRRASDEREIKEIATEVDEEFGVLMKAGDLELGRSAMTKVRSKLIGNLCELTSSR